METQIYRQLKKLIEVGTAATTGNITESAQLPSSSCMFTAERHAIHLSLNRMYATKGKHVSIFTDSGSFLQRFKTNSYQPKSQKTEAHRSKPTETRKSSGTLLDT